MKLIRLLDTVELDVNIDLETIVLNPVGEVGKEFEIVYNLPDTRHLAVVPSGGEVDISDTEYVVFGGDKKTVTIKSGWKYTLKVTGDGIDTVTQSVLVKSTTCAPPSGVKKIIQDDVEACLESTMLILPASVESIYKDSTKDMGSLKTIVVDEGSASSPENCKFKETVEGGVTKYGHVPVFKVNVDSPPVVSLPHHIFMAGRPVPVLHHAQAIDETITIDTKTFSSTSVGFNMYEITLNKGSYPVENRGETIKVIDWNETKTNYSDPGGRISYLDIPYGAYRIGARQYEGSTGVDKVIIPATVKIIGEGAFRDLPRLTDVTMVGGPREISARAFYGDASALLTLPPSIDKVDESSFYNIKSFNNNIIPDGMYEIGNESFRRILGITNATIPPSVQKMGSNPFVECNNLTSLTSLNPNFTINDYELIDEKESRLIAFVHWNEGAPTAYAMSDRVTTVGEQAVSYCPNLESVKIGSRVESISGLSFGNNPKLTKVIFKEGVKSIGEGMFEHTPNLTSITIPHSLWGASGVIHPNAFINSSITAVCCMRSINNDCPSYVGLTTFYGKDGVNVTCSSTCPDT